MELKSITKGRGTWFTEGGRLENDRTKFTGKLYYITSNGGKMVQREKFTVSIRGDDSFSVDIGTGSGVKVKFRIGG